MTDKNKGLKKIYYSGSLSSNSKEIIDHLSQYGTVITEHFKPIVSEREYSDKMGLLFLADIIVLDLTGNPPEEMYLIRGAENGGKLTLCMYDEK